MARSVSSPRAKEFFTASGMHASARSRRTSAPRVKKRVLIAVSDLPNDGLAENARGPNGKGKDQQDEARCFTPAAADEEAGQAFEGAQEEADHHHTETRVQAGNHGHCEGFQHQG